jgi:transcriptional regulator of arginine metabolism
MPQDQRYNPAQKLKRALLDHYLGAESAENLVVLKCLPGTAGTIAALIDGMDWPEIIGTIGGDDTTLIITKTKSLGEDVLKRINDIML